MHNLNLLSDYDVSKDWEEGKDCRHRRLSVDDEERNMIDLEAIREVADACPSAISMRDNDDLVSPVNEFLLMDQPRRMARRRDLTDGGQLVYVTLDTT
jgi:hypothetical protein